jgi:hypothetical protein
VSGIVAEPRLSQVPWIAELNRPIGGYFGADRHSGSASDGENPRTRQFTGCLRAALAPPRAWDDACDHFDREQEQPSVTAGEDAAGSAVGPPRQGLSVVELDDCVSIFNPVTQRAVILNATATMVWRLSDGTRDAGVIVVELASRFGLDNAAIEAEVVAAIDQLRGEGLFDEERPP